MIPGPLISRVPLKGPPRSNTYGKYNESLLRLQYVNRHFDFQMENTAFPKPFTREPFLGNNAWIECSICMVPS